MNGLVVISFYQKEITTEQMFATMFNQGTEAGIKNADSISSNRYLKLEWQKFSGEIFAFGACFYLQ
jgi:hypothetical protein